MTVPFIIAFVGPSGSGKTALMTAALKRFDYLELVKSATTRTKRGPEDDASYIFVSWWKFFWLFLTGGVVQWTLFRGNTYCTLMQQYTDLARRNKVGILAVTRDGAAALRLHGFNVKVVKVIPVGGPGRKGREDEDLSRFDVPDPDFVLHNNFRSHGFTRSVDTLCTFIKTAFNE